MNRHMYFRQQEKNELYHHGIKGQKWGIRRYQNEDGTLTEEGKERYGFNKKYSRQEIRKMKKEYAGHWGIDGVHMHGKAKDFGQSNNEIVENAIKILKDYQVTYNELDKQYNNTKNAQKARSIEQEKQKLLKERDKMVMDYIDNVLGKFKNDDITTRSFGIGPLGERMTTRSTTLEGAIIIDLNKRIKDI